MAKEKVTHLQAMGAKVVTTRSDVEKGVIIKCVAPRCATPVCDRIAARHHSKPHQSRKRAASPHPHPAILRFKPHVPPQHPECELAAALLVCFFVYLRVPRVPSLLPTCLTPSATHTHKKQTTRTSPSASRA